ncbi:cyclic GMP-binding protein C-like [Mytilus edulis]|uniref:cyclic GMP-binding protein C-like n=1 Tax=Mytilus edulis TaxID=6550 RepID=UPI0039EF96D5
MVWLGIYRYRKGETPYDLAAQRKMGQYEEVMEYLQTVMSEKSSGVNVRQGVEDDMVPTEIKLMADKRSIDLYLKLLQSGYELKRDIRLVVVGKKGAGKTSLIRRLFGEEITDVTSTNGIEIHKIKCKAMSDDGIWNKQEENNEDTQTQERLLKQYVGKLQDKRPIQEPVESHIAIQGNTPVTSFDESKKSETESEQHKTLKPPEVAEPRSEPPVNSQQPNKSSDQAAKDIETMLSAQSKIDVHDKEEYATFFLWDFAGDEEFYHTHQTFLSQDAMYLVVTKLNEADDPNARALFRLWMDSIHCYSRLDEGNNTSDKTTVCAIDPPVVIVGTWKDAVTSETDTTKIEIACRKNLLKYTNELADDERGHLRCEYFISNKDDECSAFQQIRQNILNLARGMRTWNLKYPLKFIQLERRLQEKKKESPIISYQKIKDFSTNTLEPLSKNELKLFLEFHHELRALVYFKDHPDYIILDTQWLADAFKCIVTAEKFQASTTNQKKWNEFYHTGKLNYEVLEDIFMKEATILYKHKDYILKVMEKFDIIICPNKSEGDEENPYYYVPCMIKAEPERDIYEIFNVKKDISKRSTWFCFKFRFLPPHLIHHLIASLSRKYTVAEVVDQKENKRQIALFKGTAVFELEKTTKLRKLLVKTYPSLILIQVLEYVEESNRGVYKNIVDFVIDEINKIISSRFQMSNVNFEKKWECGLTKPDLVVGRNDFNHGHGRQYFCETCTKPHLFIDEWSDLPSVSKICK